MSEIIITCGQCGAKNRVPEEKVNAGPRCGKCKTPLPAYTLRGQVSQPHVSPVNITDATFEREVLESSVPVLVDCWAAWCGPCRMVAPILDEIAREYAGRLKIAKLNTEENYIVPARYGIQSIPTMLLFKNGELVDTLIGALPKSQIEARLRQVL